MTVKKSLDPAINRVRIESLTIFEVTEGELNDLERGNPESILLNTAIAVFSIAVSFSISLATTKIDSVPLFCVFVIVMLIGYLATLVLGGIWWQTSRSLRSVIAEIRSRSSPAGIQEDGAIEVDT